MNIRLLQPWNSFPIGAKIFVTKEKGLELIAEGIAVARVSAITGETKKGRKKKS